MSFGNGPISGNGTPFSGFPPTIKGAQIITGFSVSAVLTAYLTNYISVILQDELKRVVIAIETSFLSGTPQPLYAATVPFITLSTDTPANQQFDGTLEATLRIDRSVGTGGHGGYGGFSINISELALINADAEYDVFGGNVSINGRSVVCKLGQFDENNLIIPYAQFEQLANLTAERFLVDRQHLTVQMRDPELTLTTTPVQASVYAGTGGTEGGTEIAGKRRPFGDGVVFNATPALVLPSELLYQFNAGAVASVDAVKDGGAELTFAGNYATVALLRAAAVSNPPTFFPGSYATCIADGYFVLGGVAFKQVTIDFTGLRTTTADIILNVARTSAGLADSAIDLVSFEDLNTLQPATVGYYLGTDASTTCAEMFTQMMDGIGGWHGMTALGKLTVRRFDAPDVASTLFFYDSTGGGVIDIDRTALPETVDPPPKRWRVPYQRNYTVQTDLFGVVQEDAALSDLLRNAFSVASTSDAQAATIVASYPNAPDPDPIDAYFALQADALAEANRLYTLYSSGYAAFRFTLANAIFVHNVGDMINVTDSRLGLSAGRYLRLVSVVDDTGRRTSDMVGFG